MHYKMRMYSEDKVLPHAQPERSQFLKQISMYIAFSEDKYVRQAGT